MIGWAVWKRRVCCLLCITGRISARTWPPCSLQRTSPESFCHKTVRVRVGVFLHALQRTPCMREVQEWADFCCQEERVERVVDFFVVTLSSGNLNDSIWISDPVRTLWQQSSVHLPSVWTFECVCCVSCIRSLVDPAFLKSFVCGSAFHCFFLRLFFLLVRFPQPVFVSPVLMFFLFISASNDSFVFSGHLSQELFFRNPYLCKRLMHNALFFIIFLSFPLGSLFLSFSHSARAHTHTHFLIHQAWRQPTERFSVMPFWGCYTVKEKTAWCPNIDHVLLWSRRTVAL